MKKEIEINEWIESYLNGNFSAGETTQFQKHMEEDATLAREVELHRQLRELVEDGAYLSIKNELKTIHLRKMQISGNIKRITGFGIGGLMIGLILLLVIRNVHPTSESNPVPIVALTITDTVGTSSGGAEEQSPMQVIEKYIQSAPRKTTEGPTRISLREEPLNRSFKIGVNTVSGDSMLLKIQF